MKKGINIIIEAVNAMSKDERDLFFSTATLYNLDTLAIMGYKGDLGPEYIMDRWGNYSESEKPTITKKGRKLTKKVNRKTWKNHLKDKSRHGYRNGSAKEGYVSYDAWGKRERVIKDQRLNFKNQVKELEVTSEDLDELAYVLDIEYGDKLWGMVDDLSLYYTFAKVKYEGTNIWNTILKLVPVMHEYLGALHPHLPVAAVDMAIEDLTNALKNRIEWKINVARRAELAKEINDRCYMVYEKMSEAVSLMKEARELNNEINNLRKEVEDDFTF